MEEERIAKLVAGRREREAKLVADFASDEIYDLDDEAGLAMQQALRESRRRVESLCEGRKLADCTELVTDELIQELQSFLPRWVDYVKIIRSQTVHTSYELILVAQDNPSKRCRDTVEPRLCRCLD